MTEITDYISLDDLIRAMKISNMMCGKYGICKKCPLQNLDCKFCESTDAKELAETLRVIFEWEHDHAVLIPDEVVNEVTFEATYVDKAGVLLSEEGKAERMKLLEELVKHALPQADNVRCVKIQQFITKGHEEEC